VHFVQRAQAIREAIKTISRNDSMVGSLDIRSSRPDDLSMPMNYISDEFPYHYDAKTYSTLVLML